MAMLLAGLLAYGRLSGDSEIVALRAAGASIARIVAPAGLMAILVAVVAFAVDETMVPWAASTGMNHDEATLPKSSIPNIFRR